MRKFLLLLSGMWVFTMNSQEDTSFQTYDEIVALAVERQESDDFEGTIEMLDKVNKNDSMYSSSMVSKSYYLLELERFEEAIDLIDEVLSAEYNPDAKSFFTNKAFAYTKLDKPEEAIKTYDKALEQYPVETSLLVNKAIVLEEMGEFEEALSTYKRAIILNPLEIKAHIRLGQFSYKQQKMAQALISFNMALLLNPDGNGAFGVLKSLNELVSQRNENIANPDIGISKDEELFREIDLILDNKLALNENYRVDTDIPISLTKQNHVLLGQLEKMETTEGFWSDIYIPLFKWIMANDNFELFTQTISFSIENPEYKKVVERNTDGIKAFVEDYMIKWREILQSNGHLYLEQNGATASYTGTRLDGIGPVKDGLAVGSWIYFDEDGQLVGKGSYNEKGDRDGKWSWYHKNGKVRETADYTAGEVNGKNIHYYQNGRKYIDASFSDHKLNGEYLVFNDEGALIQKKYFKDEELEGEFTSYFNAGEKYPEIVANYRNGEIEGKAFEYFENGTVYMEMNFVKGVKEGVEKTFFRNGKPYLEIMFQDGQKHGTYREYNLQGDLVQEGNYAEGEMEGEWKVYHPDGKLAKILFYNKGKADGLYREFDTDGKLYFEYDYRKGEIIGYRFFNKNAETIVDERKKGGEFYYTGFSPYGEKTSEGLYDVSGGRTEEWKFYNENGILYETGTYKMDLTQGKVYGFYPSGDKSSEINFIDGLKEGYAVYYHPNGNIQSHGIYKEDLRQGVWKEYFIDGTLKTENYFHKDDLNGEQLVYSVDGRLYNSNHYKFGDLEFAVQYSSEGEAVDTVHYNQDKNEYVLTDLYPSGKKWTSTNYLHGLKHGSFKSFNTAGALSVEGNYFNNQMHGAWKFYNDEGKLKLEEEYEYGNKHGKSIGYYDNGQIDTQTTYVYDSREGTSISYHENGQISVETPYRDGVEHGQKKFFDSQGHLQQIRFYDHGRIVGYTYADKNGEIKPMIPLQNETGELKTFYENGKESRTTMLVGGEFNDDYNTYYFNGNLKEVSPYKHGMVDGVNIEYYPTGNKKAEKNYVYDNLHGIQKEYYENGKLKSETLYKNDEEIGPAIYYDEAGEVSKKEIYFNGDLVETENLAG